MLSRTHAAHCSTLRKCTTVVIGRGSQHKCTRSHAKILVHKHVHPPKCRVHEQERRRPSFLPACVRSCILRSEIQEIRDCNGSNFCSNKDLFISQWGHKTTIFDGCIEMHPSAATPLVACPTERDHASCELLLQSTRPTAEPQHAYKSRPTTLCTHHTSH